MDSGYLDLGLDSDSDDEMKLDCLDSDEEEAIQNEALLKMMMMPHSKTEKERHVEDFEAEMEAELNRRAAAVEIEGGLEHQKSLSRTSSSNSLQLQSCSSKEEAPRCSSTARSRSNIDKPKKTVRFNNTQDEKHELKPLDKSIKHEQKAYDDVYFDSDDSDTEDADAKEKKLSNRKILSNDDLFYDPKSDEKDQVWVNKQRSHYILETESNKRKLNSERNEENPQPFPINSDAVLNCPACFTVLCLDCQRHDFYQGQFRAMFTMNCVIDKNENRYVPAKSEKYKNRKRKHDQETQAKDNSNVPTFQTDSSNTFNPVKCKICKTEVAVYDSDEVYHFFNVLTSHS